MSGVRSELQIQIDEMETQLNTQLEERERLENTIRRDNGRIANLARSITTLQQRYELLLNSFNQAAIQQLTRSNALTIIENASLPEEREGPKVLRDTVVAAIIGLFGGVGLGFAAESRKMRAFTRAARSPRSCAPK